MLDTMKTTLEYGKRYRLLKRNQEVVEGEHIQTRGNDRDFPVFLMDGGGQLGVSISNVLGLATEDCNPHGMVKANGLIQIEDENLNIGFIP